MFKAEVTTATCIPHVTVGCSRTSSITTTVTIASTAADIAALGQQDVVLLPQLIWRDTMRGYVGLTTEPQQHNLSPKCLPRLVMAFAFCFEVLKWLSCSPMRAEPLEFALKQPFRIYTW